MNVITEDLYKVRLPLFEGPLDLLLHLIKENKIDIYDIPIAIITRQYLEYIELMKELDLDIAGEFLVMAATLIHIKSRLLLPIEETADTEELEDPRLELVQRLLAYKEFKEASLGLKEREDEWADIMYREAVPEQSDTPEEDASDLSLFNLNIFDLLTAFRKILERAPAELVSITREALSITDRMAHIIEVLRGNEAVRFEDLFKGNLSKAYLIVTFVALLEAIRLGLARVYQEDDFGQVWVIRPEDNVTSAGPHQA